MSLLDEVKAWPMPELEPPETLITDADVGSRAYTARQVRDHIRTAREAVAAEADREMAQRDATIERLIEDRARFPDRPDDIGAMIGAHFNNLRAIANMNEEAWRRTQLHSDVEVARLRAALERIVRDCTARKAVMIARAALSEARKT